MKLQMTQDEKDRADFISKLNFIQLKINKLAKEMENGTTTWQDAKSQFVQSLKSTITNLK